MEINVEHLGSLQFQTKTRGHSIVSDQPVEQGGYDEGMTPPELFLASLGSCAGYYAAQYLKTQIGRRGDGRAGHVRQSQGARSPDGQLQNRNRRPSRAKRKASSRFAGRR
jgi:uncharacterized OsmC-like protein